jgi:hypothetical protein
MKEPIRLAIKLVLGDLGDWGRQCFSWFQSTIHQCSAGVLPTEIGDLTKDLEVDGRFVGTLAGIERTARPFSDLRPKLQTRFQARSAKRR